ncbi:MAG: ATP-binding protein, partial [Chloroflexi bacterium]|nr:ATP-binding protein [Chloroflexota bacterium]
MSGQPFGDLRARNPWWVGPGGLARDPQLSRLERAPFRREPSLMGAFDFSQPNVYTLRGPRQVGKTTLLKQLAARLIQHDGWDPRQVVFYPLDLVERPAQIVDLAQRVKAAYAAGRGQRWTFLLDEVSSVPDWQRGIKYLRDNTDAAEDCFILTGSAAHDIRRGGERLPGRRGPGTDLDRVLLPLSFPEFLAATRPGLAPVPPLRLSAFLTSEADAPVREAMLSLDELEHALELYAETGGFPSAVGDFLRDGSVSARTVADAWDIVAGDVDRWGRQRVEALRLLGRLVRSLGSMLDWQSLAVDMGVSQPTAEAYANLLADSFLLSVLYVRGQNGAIAPRKGKKLYPVDPLMLQIPAQIEGSAPPALAQVVESLVAGALFRACESDLVESFRVPKALSFWRTSRDREIDFLAGPRPRQIAVEVKYQTRVSARDTLSIRNALGRGLVLSQRDLALDGPVRILPAAVFLALLRGEGGAA